MSRIPLRRRAWRLVSNGCSQQNRGCNYIGEPRSACDVPGLWTSPSRELTR